MKTFEALVYVGWSFLWILILLLAVRDLFDAQIDAGLARSTKNARMIMHAGRIVDLSGSMVIMSLISLSLCALAIITPRVDPRGLPTLQMVTGVLFLSAALLIATLKVLALQKRYVITRLASDTFWVWLVSSVFFPRTAVRVLDLQSRKEEIETRAYGGPLDGPDGPNGSGTGTL